MYMLTGVCIAVSYRLYTGGWNWCTKWWTVRCGL